MEVSIFGGMTREKTGMSPKLAFAASGALDTSDFRA